MDQYTLLELAHRLANLRFRARCWARELSNPLGPEPRFPLRKQPVSQAANWTAVWWAGWACLCPSNQTFEEHFSNSRAICLCIKGKWRQTLSPMPNRWLGDWVEYLSISIDLRVCRRYIGTRDQESVAFVYGSHSIFKSSPWRYILVIGAHSFRYSWRFELA